jgi:hypothetical protein
MIDAVLFCQHCNCNDLICKPFVIPYQYPTLILVGSDLTFTVSDPTKMVGHKIRIHHSKFRPKKNSVGDEKFHSIQSRIERIPMYTELGLQHFTVSYLENAQF